MTTMDRMYCFEENEIKILFDKMSGAFFEVNDDIYENLNNSYASGVDNEMVAKISDAINSRQPLYDSIANEGTRLGRLSFLTTQVCNLECKYCFADHGSYNRQDEKIMSSQVMKDSFLYFINKFSEGVNLIHFFGGEPLLGYESIKEFVPWCLETCRERKIVPPVFSIVTNGTVFSREMTSFFNTYKINIVISIDGPKELNDKTRVSDSIKSVFDKIAEDIQWLSKDREFNIGCEMTINKYHIDEYIPGSVKYWLDSLNKLGFNYATVGIAETSLPECKIPENQRHIYAQIEKEVIDYFFNRFANENSFYSAEIISCIMRLAGKSKALPCGAGYHSLTVNAKGYITPCYQFYKDSKFIMSNIYNDDIKKYQQVSEIFKDTEKYKPEECKDCWLENVCSVLCRGFSYNSHGSISHISQTRCWAYDSAFRRIMYNIIKLKKEPEKYKKAVSNIYKFNKTYSYNKDII